MAGRLTRREFLAAAGAVGALGATGAWRSLARAATTTPLPAPLASGIDHIVVVCMENRSFDHFLGWVPNANGQQAGLSYSDDNGVLHPTHQLTDWTGCGFNDPVPSVSWCVGCSTTTVPASCHARVATTIIPSATSPATSCPPHPSRSPTTPSATTTSSR